MANSGNSVEEKELCQNILMKLNTDLAEGQSEITVKDIREKCFGRPLLLDAKAKEIDKGSLDKVLNSLKIPDPTRIALHESLRSRGYSLLEERPIDLDDDEEGKKASKPAETRPLLRDRTLNLTRASDQIKSLSPKVMAAIFVGGLLLVSVSIGYLLRSSFAGLFSSLPSLSAPSQTTLIMGLLILVGTALVVAIQRSQSDRFQETERRLLRLNAGSSVQALGALTGILLFVLILPMLKNIRGLFAQGADVTQSEVTPTGETASAPGTNQPLDSRIDELASDVQSVSVRVAGIENQQKSDHVLLGDLRRSIRAARRSAANRSTSTARTAPARERFLSLPPEGASFPQPKVRGPAPRR